MENIFVFDDVIPEFLQDFYEGIIFGKTRNTELFPTVEFSVRYEPTAEEHGHIPLSFNHVLKSSAKISPHLENFSKLVTHTCKHANLNFRDIFYGRIFLTTPQKTNLDFYQPHTDLNYPHWVVLYYVNDADGDTAFYDSSGNIIKTVTPKKGRVVLFDGLIKHSGGIPKETTRCIVNFDIVT
jgi:hypothetical protein